MKNVLGRLRRGHRPDTEALSAYAEGVLSAGDATRLAEHLSSCMACSRELDELRRVRAMLSSMGHAPVPRSFRLRPADVESRASAKAAGVPSRALAFAPAVSMAAFLLFGAVLAADVVTRDGEDDRGMFAASGRTASESLSMADSAATESVPADVDEAQDGTDTGVAAGATELESPAAAPEVDSDDDYYAASPPAGQAPAPSDDRATRNADEAEALSASSDDGDGVRAAYLAAEIALASLAAGALAWFIYQRRRKREVED